MADRKLIQFVGTDGNEYDVRDEAAQQMIGTTALPTTAQTLTGAIAEHEADLGTKADKVASAVNGNFAGLDGNGNLTDSGSNASDFVPVDREINGKALSTDVTLTGDDITVSAEDEQTVSDAVTELNTAVEAKADQTQVDKIEKELTGKADKDSVFDYKGAAPGSVVEVYDAVAEAVTQMQIEIAPVQEGTGDPSPENVRPISGFTGCEVTRKGKNLIGLNTSPGGTIEYSNVTASDHTDDSVKLTSTNNTYANMRLYYTLPAGTYTVKYQASVSDNNVGVAFYNGNSIFVNPFSPNTEQSFTLAEQTLINIRLFVTLGTATAREVTFSQFQLEMGSSASAYEPYANTAYTITFPAAAGTVYGGTLAVNADGTGELVVDMASIDLGSLEWNKSGSNNNGFYYTMNSNKYKMGNVEMLCEMYAYGGAVNSDYYTNNTIKCYKRVVSSFPAEIYVMDSRYTDAASFKTAMSGVHLVYELATPVTYQLTAPQIRTIIGYNRVWADTGSILSMLYPAEKYQTVEQAEKGLIHNTATGAIASFADGADDLPMALTVGIEPVQDLHGYENPWPGGGGKNILPLTIAGLKASNTSGTWSGNAYTWRGITFTALTDDAGNVTGININGTATDTTVLYLKSDFEIIDSSEYIYSGITSGSTSTYRFECYWRDSNNTSKGIAFVTTDPVTIKVSDKTDAIKITTFCITVMNGTTVSNQKVYPMIRLSSVSDATFEPYSNICPISGWTGANVSRTGVNVWDEEWEIGFITMSTGQPQVANDAIRSKNYTSVKASTSYYFVTPYTTTSQAEYVYYYDSSKAFLSYTKITGSRSFTTPENTVYIRFAIANLSTPVSYGNNISINYPETDTLYHSGKQNATYPITFPSSAGTVYGGTLTVNKDGTGSLVVDHYYDLLDGNKTYQKWSSSAPLVRYNPSVPVKPVSTNSEVAKIISSYFITRDASIVANFDVDGIAVASIGVIIFRKKGLTYEENIAYVTSNPLQVVYELATPVTYTLTAPQVRTLLGMNNVWADTGDTTANYPADTKMYIDKALSASRNLMELIVTANREDSMKATKAYSTGDLLIVNGTLYKATTSIANGATLTVGTNVTATTVATELAALA